MDRFCSNCGNKISIGAGFCPECGSEVGNESAVLEKAMSNACVQSDMNETTQAADASKAQLYQTLPRQIQTQDLSSHATQQICTSDTGKEAQPIYQTVTHAATADYADKVIGTGAYFGMMLLFSLPIIGFIICIVMCFAPKNKNVKNFARAILIWIIIGLIIGGLVVAGVYAFSESLTNYISSAFDGQFDNWSELLSNFE